ncbi:hypothetical protein BO94DRAFT_228146 [Aspergillus sclerotioniger CBS 115572]|uniref:Uncharacterized protein n=1 Tax=Aspergillus sclerotioniger CBS 115572 TaxID=1450535 RepID=A0A317VJI1_9EURO|nr:hypothetical protein BO94DRAFT_228146 [Aspergillus sclerotioniger CBS 115572]PWY74524.1 hypothetical protein BO94DRAFT_228146 [Aspergillus sclerotioniger CBS 115572]
MKLSPSSLPYFPHCCKFPIYLFQIFLSRSRSWVSLFLPCIVSDPLPGVEPRKSQPRVTPTSPFTSPCRSPSLPLSSLPPSQEEPSMSASIHQLQFRMQMQLFFPTSGRTMQHGIAPAGSAAAAWAEENSDNNGGSRIVNNQHAAGAHQPSLPHANLDTILVSLSRQIVPTCEHPGAD